MKTDKKAQAKILREQADRWLGSFAIAAALRAGAKALLAQDKAEKDWAKLVELGKRRKAAADDREAT